MKKILFLEDLVAFLIMPMLFTENNNVETLSHQSRIPSLNPTQVTSDVDADVSSLETDAVDSDN